MSSFRSRTVTVLRRLSGACFLLLCIAGTTAQAEAVVPRAAAIASAHPLATQAGYDVLARGGNAFDAAVTVAAALAVVEPYSSGLGGGGFWLLHRAADGFETMLDGRETAPGAASAALYQDSEGELVPGASLNGARAAGIPGVPAALSHLAERYGKLPLRITLAPAIHYARHGFAVDARYAFMAQLRAEVLRADASTARIFLGDDKLPQVGYWLRQPALATTLETLAQHDHHGFYRGAVARELVRSVQAAGGVWTLQDLKNYQVVERAPVKFTYRGATITAASLPSSGGVTLAQSLNILERMQWDTETDKAHLVVEAMRRAYHDRARYLGDPDFVAAPVEQLANKDYAAGRAASIELQQATPSAALAAADAVQQGDNTTHYSIVDAAGNRVAATLSINIPFGAALVAGNTGVLLNDEMDDFAMSAGVANIYGLVHGSANLIQPGKRPLSSMTPTFVEDAKGLLILGTPGGSRIISMVLLTILDYLESPAPNLRALVSAPRYHHQYLPDHIEIEPDAFSAEWIKVLEQRGHTLKTASRQWGNMQAVWVDKASGRSVAASDPRGEDFGWY